MRTHTRLLAPHMHAAPASFLLRAASKASRCRRRMHRHWLLTVCGQPSATALVYPFMHVHRLHRRVRRYYFYAQAAASGGLFLVEMVVATDSRQATTTVKCDAGGAAALAGFVAAWQAALGGFLASVAPRL